jgi:RsiW-degrading membrane proteinase PrsW (M82 family)
MDAKDEEPSAAELSAAGRLSRCSKAFIGWNLIQVIVIPFFDLSLGVAFGLLWIPSLVLLRTFLKNVQTSVISLDQYVKQFIIGYIVVFFLVILFEIGLSIIYHFSFALDQNTPTAFYVNLGWQMYISAGIVEESVKWWIVERVFKMTEGGELERVWTTRILLVVNCVVGFSTIENISYVMDAWEDGRSMGGLLRLVTLRMLWTTTMHVSTAVFITLRVGLMRILGHFSWIEKILYILFIPIVLHGTFNVSMVLIDQITFTWRVWIGLLNGCLFLLIFYVLLQKEYRFFFNLLDHETQHDLFIV